MHLRLSLFAALAFATLSVTLSASACGPDTPPEEKRDPTLSALSSDVFEPRCSATVCHGGSSPSADLSLVEDLHGELVGIESFTNPGQTRVVAGDPDSSLLYLVMLDAVDAVPRMPKNGPKLDQIDIDQIKAWIEDGAKDN